MTYKVAINGFGRIGRNAFKIAQNHPDLEVVVDRRDPLGPELAGKDGWTPDASSQLSGRQLHDRVTPSGDAGRGRNCSARGSGPTGSG